MLFNNLQFYTDQTFFTQSGRLFEPAKFILHVLKSCITRTDAWMEKKFNWLFHFQWGCHVALKIESLRKTRSIRDAMKHHVCIQRWQSIMERTHDGIYFRKLFFLLFVLILLRHLSHLCVDPIKELWKILLLSKFWLMVLLHITVLQFCKSAIAITQCLFITLFL